MDTAARAPRMESLFKIAIWATLYLLPITRALTPQIDPDTWWHLRTGETIVQQRQIPSTDTFSRHGIETGKPWLAYSWLFEVVLYGFYQVMGLPGIAVLRLTLVLAVALAIHRLIARRETRFPVAAALFGAALVAIGPLMSERPWLVTILFSTLLLDAVLDLRERGTTRWSWLLPLLFILWANVHIQFVYGLLILGMACVAPLADRLSRRWLPGTEASECLPQTATAACAGATAWWRLILLTAMCALATLLNPYGIKLYSVVLEYATHQAPLDIVTELRPLDFRSVRDFAMPVLAAVALFALGRRKQWSFFELLLLAVAGWFSFRMRRDVWFLTLVALTILVTRPRLSVTGEPHRQELPFRPTYRQALLLAAALLALIAATWQVHLHPGAIETSLSEDYPVEAVRFVKTTGYRGPIYNTFDWGGYLIWNLRDLPVSLDGRTNLHGDARLAQAYVTWTGQSGWDRDPELLQAAIVIEDVSAPAAATIRADERFRVVYEDRRAIVLERKSPVTMRTAQARQAE